MTKKYTWYCGLTTKSGEPITKDAYQAGLKALETAVDGYTLSYAIGSWRGKEEPTLVVTVIDLDEMLGYLAAENVARILAKHGRQECVLWTVEKVEAFLKFSI